MIKYIILFLSFISLSWAAEEQSRLVESIAYTGAGDKHVAQISLSDGSTWNYVCDVENEHLLVDLEDTLAPQTEVFIKALFYTRKYELFTLDADGNKKAQYYVSLTKETARQLPTIVKKEKKIIEPAGWFSSAKYGYVISLSDGTTWDLSNSSFHQNLQLCRGKLMSNNRKNG
jgi:hypothetical protein